MNVHVLYVLEHKTSKKISVCLYGCLVVPTYVHELWLWTQ